MASTLGSPPGPKGLDVLRFFGGGSFAKTLAYFQEVAQRYGPIASFAITGRRLHLVTGPELVRQVLVVDQLAYTRANGAAILRDLLGDSMLTVDEPRHRIQRRCVAPAFGAQRIATYGAAMVDAAVSAGNSWRDGDAVDMSAATMRLALAIVGRALFGSDMRGRADALERALTPAMRVVSWLGPILEALPPQANVIRLRLPLRANVILARAKAQMTAIVAELIAIRRANPSQDSDDLLSTLLNARDATGAALDPQTITGELVTVLLAGHETTANALAWALLEVARRPALQARIHAELATVLGERDIPTTGDLPHLILTSHVFAETLRLYPPASAFGRRELRRCALGGFAIGAGDGIIVSPFVNQRNPVFFPDPERFDPDRWDATVPPPFAYFPFGGGSRVCIGESFARTEGTLVLATLLRRFVLSPADDAPNDIAQHATLRPARPIVLSVTRRVAAS